MFSPIVDMDIKDPDNPNDLAQMDGYVYDDTESAYVRLYIYTDAEGNVMAKSFYVTDDDALTVMDEICSGVNHTAWYRRVGIELMPLWGAVVALVAAIAAIVLDVRKIENKKARTAGIIIASIIGAVSLVYIALTLILVSAVD